ncbi:uncharacterized protein LOC9641488 [Selaginella moellendorffii]|nr:uncharacterized protein LOC9641488 [Selaginella moellendorffii]|eukprot:XP_002960999.2 uncharacterized protein LOC9641488 [Selaginella moellendorffii]
MVQRLVDGGGEPETGNCSSLSWQGLHFGQRSSDRGALGKIGDMLLQLKSGGEFKVPVGVSFQQKRCDNDEDLELAPGPKRHKLSDLPFKTKTWATTVSGESSFEGRLRTRVPFTVSAHSYHPLDEPSPLGLTLKKTPSFLDLVSMTISQGCGSSDSLLNDGSSQGIANRSGIPNANQSQGKLKASNFPASTLKIGSWERVSRYEGDVVAKCYYAKRKLVWEVLETGLKSKIELQWSDISAIRASYGDGQLGILEVEVSRPPLFFKETNPQPRKHTLWEATSDFTGGEATICKRHVLQFPEGVLNKHYEKLLQCDARLKALAGPAPNDELHQEVTRDSKSKQVESEQPLMCPRVKLELPLESRCSPSSVMESRGSDDSDTEECPLRSVDSQALVAATPSDKIDEEEEDDDDTLEQKPRVLVLTDKEVLNEIAQILLGETSAAKPSPERGLFRVSSMSGFVEDGWVPATYSVSDWSSADPAHGSEGYGSDEKSFVTYNSESGGRNSGVLFELDEKPSLKMDESLGSGSSGDFGSGSGGLHDSVKQCFTRHGSAGDLLVNLPRIASLPQLFENGVARRDSHLSFLELL